MLFLSLSCYLSGDAGGGTSQRVSVSPSLFTMLYEVTRVRLELRLFNLVQFTVAPMLFQFLVTPLTLLTPTLLLPPHPAPCLVTSRPLRKIFLAAPFPPPSLRSLVTSPSYPSPPHNQSPVEMPGNGFLHSHSLPFPCNRFPFLPIPIPNFVTNSHSHKAFPIPCHSHSRTLHRCSIYYFGLGKTQA